MPKPEKAKARVLAKLGLSRLYVRACAYARAVTTNNGTKID